jgi:hypothetical protein
VEHHEGNWNSEHDDSGTERVNVNPDSYIEGFILAVIGSGSLERFMECSSTSHAHPDEQQDPIEENQ